MKLIRCRKDGREFAAVSDGKLCYEAAADMYGIIEKLKKVSVESLMVGESFDITEAELLAPMAVAKEDIMCLGLNYRAHIAEAEQSKALASTVEDTGKAVYFGKRAAYIVGHGEPVEGHFDMTNALDYEVELAVVLGKDAYKVSKEDAFDYVLGYSVFNDYSARDLQKAHKQFYFGKSLDGYTAMGPWIVTVDELGEASDLGIRCYVNGEIRQDGNTGDMIYGIAHAISELSQGLTLKAGTIIATGTPDGVGMGFNPPKYLKPGDLVRCEIDKVGVLENNIK